MVHSGKCRQKILFMEESLSVITSFRTKPAAFTLPRISLNISPSVLLDVPWTFLRPVSKPRCKVPDWNSGPGQVKSIIRTYPFFVITPSQHFFVPDHRTIPLTWWCGSPASEGCDAIACWNMVEDSTSHSIGHNQHAGGRWPFRRKDHWIILLPRTARIVDGTMSKALKRNASTRHKRRQYRHQRQSNLLHAVPLDFLCTDQGYGYSSFSTLHASWRHDVDYYTTYHVPRVHSCTYVYVWLFVNGKGRSHSNFN